MNVLPRNSRILLICSLLVGLTACSKPPSEAEVPAEVVKKPAAKNVILFIGDGMGVSTVTAMRIYAGQKAGATGEENVLPFETFDHVALVKTYNTNQQVPDSAGTASAMNTGAKTRAGMIGVAPSSHRQSCEESLNATLPTLAEKVQEQGKAIGIVSTARLTHATPAAVYAHSPERDWESDAELTEEAKEHGCLDIAQQLVNFPFTVALGGGAKMFTTEDQGGERQDGQDLAASWQKSGGGSYVTTLEELEKAKTSKPVLGLFSSSHMTYEIDRARDTTEPTLTDMTEQAINRLKTNSSGYFLMVEAGRIDHAHHEGRAGYAMEEGYAFSKAIQKAMDMVDPEETLILVTADHSHVFTLAGYPTRGNPILGIVKGNDDSGEPSGKPMLATDGQPYTTLGYINGPGAVEGKRPRPQEGPRATQQALVPTGYSFDGTHNLSETHGGEDVALYGQGPGAENVKGVMEQNKLYNVMADAFGL